MWGRLLSLTLLNGVTTVTITMVYQYFMYAMRLETQSAQIDYLTSNVNNLTSKIDMLEKHIYLLQSTVDEFETKIVQKETELLRSNTQLSSNLEDFINYNYEFV